MTAPDPWALVQGDEFAYRDHREPECTADEPSVLFTNSSMSLAETLHGIMAGWASGHDQRPR